MRLKDFIVISAVGCSEIAGGCTSPNPEDAKNETHPVCAVPDVRGDTITWEMVAVIRDKCSGVGNEVFRKESGYEDGPNESTFKSKIESAISKAGKAEQQCLDLHGLNE